MKKRILSLLLALVTVFYILPIGSIPAIALDGTDEETGLSIEDMEVGKLYSAKWDYTNSDFIPYCPDSDGEFMVWKGFPEIYEDEAYVLKNDFPQSLIIKRMNADEEAYVYVTNEDWPEEYDNYRYVYELELTITGEYTPPADDGYIYGKVGIFCEDAVDGTLTLGKGEKVQAFTELDAEISENAKYQWQMKLEDDRWAAITDCFYSWINISEALITNAKGENATLRCAVTDGTKKYASEELKVAMEPEINAVYAGANGAGNFVDGLKGTNTLDADSEAYQAQIDYYFVHTNGDINDKPAANPFVHTFQDAEHKLSATISSPYIEGYTACVPDENGTIVYNEKKYTAKPSHTFNNVGIGSSESELQIKIFYVPNLVSYTVEYYEQNLTDDSYRRAGQDRKYGYTDDTVADDLAVEREGFKSRYYDDTLTIAGNEDTVVEIYYDRIYYLVDFDLDGGYGTTPYYVRYGTSVMLTKPTRSGYTFNDPWIISSVDGKTIDEWRVDDSTLADTYSSSYAGKNANALIVVKNNLKYTASWSVGETIYTIVYWLENTESTDSADIGNYDVWYTVPIDANTGDTTAADAGGDQIKKYVTNTSVSAEAKAEVDATYDYLEYELYLSDTGTKKVSGDGTTAINVYYSRRTYSIKFYYARRNGSTYQVSGGTEGSSNSGGTVASANWNQNVATLPELADSPLKETASSETISGNTYYYFILTAKYGANLQSLWPASIVESVYLLNSTTDKINFVSWGTQYGCDYNLIENNRNIKGVYQELDNRIIVDPNNTQAQFMVGYWNIGAKEVQYKVYYEVDSETYQQENSKQKTIKEGRYFILETENTLRTSEEAASDKDQQTALKYDGVKEISSYRTLTTNSEPYIYYYYFERIDYKIYYNDKHGNTTSQSVPYGTSLNDEIYMAEPLYPNTLEEGQCVFIGWYIDEACQIPFDFTEKMPAKNIQLYAKWETTKHDVKVYRQESEIGSTESGKLLIDYSGENAVEFGTQISEPENNTYTAPADNYIFDGWYYKVDGEEKRYDFNTMVIKQETVIYAKWAKNVQVAYSVEYVTNTGTPENPVYVNIGKTETGYSLAGIPKTFTAKMGSELYEGYTEWYFPNDRYITHVMTESADTNKVVFIYQTAEKIEYTIKHIFVSQKFIDQIRGERFTYSKTFTMTKNPTGDEESFKATIVERFDDLVKPDLIKAEATLQNATDPDAVWTIISGMTPDYLVQELDLTFNSDDNVITFKWVESENTRNYQIIHYLQNKDLTTYDTYISQTYTVSNDPSLVIKALWDDPFGFTRKEFRINGSVQANSTDSDEMSVILGDSGNLILEFYYDRAYFTYTVHHYVTGTTTKAADTPDDIYDGSTTTLKKAFYEQEIKIGDVARDLTSAGYYLHNGSTVRVINDDNLELICFYNPAEVQFLFQEQIPGRGQLTGDAYPVYVGHVGEKPNASVTATANDGYRFVGWIMDGGLSIDTYATVVGSTITPNKPTAEMANKTYTFFAVFEPTTKVFKNTGVADANQAFIYHIRGVDDDNDDVNVTFIITGNGQITLAMLPYGNYEITVLGWAWRYGLPNSQTQATWNVEINSTADFVFAYSGTPTDQWLTDDAAGTVTPGS